MPNFGLSVLPKSLYCSKRHAACRPRVCTPDILLSSPINGIANSTNSAVLDLSPELELPPEPTILFESTGYRLCPKNLTEHF